MNTQNRRDIPSSEACIITHKGRFFSWSAVIVGALVGIGISFLLNLFGVAIGLTAFTTTTAANASTPTFAIGGFLGLLIVSIISMSALGWVAGYLGALKKVDCNNGIVRCNYGCLYGFTAWCLALIVTIFLSAHIGKFISFSVAALTNPTVAVEKYSYPETNVQTTVTKPSGQTTASVNSEEAKKALAVAAFTAFILFIIGAFFATLAGHIAFERCVRKHGGRME